MSVCKSWFGANVWQSFEEVGQENTNGETLGLNHGYKFYEVTESEFRII